MPHGSFRVDPDELHRLAGRFDAAADHIASALTRYAMLAQPHRDAFGLLPNARAAHGTYQARAREGHDGLRRVHQAFQHSLAGGLRVTAANYVRSDHDRTPS